jgi:hypothetical protein
MIANLKNLNISLTPHCLNTERKFILDHAMPASSMNSYRAFSYDIQSPNLNIRLTPHNLNTHIKINSCKEMDTTSPLPPHKPDFLGSNENTHNPNQPQA